MEAENFISLPACSGAESETEDILSLPGESEAIEERANNETPQNNGNVGSEGTQLLHGMDNDIDFGKNHSAFQVSIEINQTLEVTEKMNSVNSKMCTDNGFVTVKDESNIASHREDPHLVRRSEIGPSALSGAKRPRSTLEEEQPSVHVIYNALTRESKQKLEELLRQWSQWHAEHCSSLNDSTKGLESGEETYFPALHVGLEKPCAVSFWMDDLPRNKKAKEYTPLDDNSVPLYDRGYTTALTSPDGSNNLEGGLEVVDVSRCFNCGSYSHSMKDCRKPRDTAAVNIARKQHMSRRIQNASSRNSTRYYQNSPKGKYDGLRPGVLDPETKRILGLGELDPPPWLNRMREIGYPPGYLDPDNEDMPSGITIFADEEIEEETEEGEILEKTDPEPPPKKMSVEFPGINAPVPEDADKWRWAAGSSSWKISRTSSYSRHNHTSDREHYLERQLSRDFQDEGHDHRTETINRGHHHEKLPGDFEDEGPPGCGHDPVMSPSLSHRFRGHDSNFSSPSPRDGSSAPKSHSYGRSSSDRGRRSLLVHDSSSNHSSYSR
ncbi:zinc finger CCHC domain-containing protein 8-like [Ipomoea triloba]|uniref:zinc finger CCHC domain-containing protein 8-like n=1 Tax=Ipomoea triloba TaxID=35885 RepID=UPI00125DD63F|nr:zinc finger CCHC domain-containing protein 8-like [Ipomoea triloba]